MYIKKIITLILFLSSGYLLAQSLNPHIDSLKQQLAKTNEVERAIILTELSKIYVSLNMDSAVTLADQAAAIYQKSKADTALVKLYIDFSKVLTLASQGEVALKYLSKAKRILASSSFSNKYHVSLARGLTLYYNINDNYDSALFYADQTLKIATDTLDRIIALKMSGLVCNSAGLTVKALKNYLDALHLVEKFNSPIHKANILNNLGILYEDDGDNDTAERYYKQSHALLKEINNLNELFSVLTNLGILCDHQHRYEESLDYLREAENLLPKLNIPRYYPISNINFGNTLTHMGRANEAISHLLKAKAQYIALNSIYGITSSNRQLAEAYLRAGRYSEAKQSGELALKLAKQYRFQELEKNAYQDLLETYEATHQYEKAFQYQKLYLNIQDSLNNKSRRSKIGLLEKEYELSQSEVEKQKLENENKIQRAEARVNKITNIALLSGLSALVLLAFVITKAYLRTRSKNKLLAEQKAIIEDANVTITKQAEELKENAETKARFFANVSHELRTPVTLLNGMLELMQEESSTPLKTHERMQIALASSSKLQHLVDEVLDLSRIDASKVEVKKKRIELTPMLNRIVLAFESLVAKKNISLQYETSLLIGTFVMIDEDKFEKIINNLIYNAIKFNRDGGWIKISGHIENNYATLQISDSGVGIPQEDLPHIFDRFYQSNFTSHKNLQGIGIGLSLVKEFMLLHEGNVSVHSEINVGSTFTLHFPTAENNVPSEIDRADDDLEEIPVEIDLTRLDQKPVVLFVEDNDEMRFYLKEIFKNDVTVVEAVNGKEGLKWLKNNIPNLIISDVMMPEMDGYEFLSQLKSDERYKNIPTVMLTARASEEDLLQGLSLGVDDYIVKPFNAKELKIRIHNLLVNQRMRSQWYATPIEKEEEIEEITEDKIFLEKVQHFVAARAQNALLSVTDLADHVAMSERQLYRKCGLLTGMTPAQLIKEIRLKMAYKMLVEHKVNKVSDLATRVGFDNSAYFSRQFLERFGKKPIEFL